MQKDSSVFVGLDASKLKISVALAEEGRQGEIRFLGDIENTPEAVLRLVNKLTGKYRKLQFCYEAGPTGYGLHRQIVELGHDCAVIAPSLIPKRRGERVKTNRRDAVALAPRWRVDGNLGPRLRARSGARSGARPRSRHAGIASEATTFAVFLVASRSNIRGS